MERDVFGHAVFAIRDGGFDLRERGVDGGHLRVGATHRGFRCHFRLDRPPQRENLHDRAGLDGLGVIDPQRPDARALDDEHAAALLCLDHALVLETRNRLADHGAAHAEFLREHCFGRQLAAFGEAAFFDLLL